MTYEDLVQSISGKKTIICFVGAGGKTSLIRSLAKTCSLMGRKVLVTTTTHIIRPDKYYAKTYEAVLELWRTGRYACIGTETSNNKLKAPVESIYRLASGQADLVLIEADGSKMHPCKIPESHEPVITDDCDIVIGLMGMTAIGKPLKDKAFRFETAGGWLNETGDTIISPEIAAKILCHERGTRKNVRDKKYIVALNQCDDDILLGHAKKIEHIISKYYDIPVLCLRLK